MIFLKTCAIDVRYVTYKLHVFFSGIHGREGVHGQVPGDGQGGTSIRPGEVQMLFRGE